MRAKEIFQTLIKPQEHSLKIQSIRAAVWSILGKGGGHLLRMVGSLIFTRILFPEAFGLMATATVALTMVNLFSDTGVKTAIIQNPRGAEPEFLNTAWIISISRGGLLSIILFCLANPLSQFYNEPNLKGILFIMAFNPLILGFESPSLSLFIKKFRVEKQVAFELVTQLLGLTSSIVLAIILRSVYALAIGVVLTSFYRTLGSYIVTRYRPVLSWNREAGSELFHFGKYIFLNTMVTWVVLNADILLIGKFLGMDTLGFYNLGKNFSYLVMTFCLQIVSQAYLPAVSSVSNDLTRVIRIYEKTATFFLAVAIPASMILVLFSHDIIKLFYDPRYESAYISMFWLSLAGIFHCKGTISGTTFIAMGRPVLQTITMTIGIIATFSFLLFGIKIGGLSGAAIGMSSSLIFIAIVESVFLVLRMEFPYRIVLRPWLLSIPVISVISGLFLLLRPWLASEDLYNIPFMFVMGLLGMAVSGGMYILLEGPQPYRDEGKSNRGLIFKALS